MDTKEQPETTDETSEEAASYEEQTLASYGIDVDRMDVIKRTMFENQERFLELFRKYGTKGSCARRARVSRQGVHLWETQDSLGFRSRIRDAHEEYVNSQEEGLQEIAETKKHPLAYIARLNKESKEWNRPETIVIDNTRQRLLDMLQEGREGNAIEGRWTPAELPEGDAEPTI